MDNRRTIFNLVVSVIASILVPFAIFYFVNDPTTLIKSLGICTAAGLFLAVVEFFIVGFSSYIEKYASILVLTCGFGITIISSTVVIFMHTIPLWQCFLWSFLVTIVLLLLHLFAFVLGTLHYCRRG